MSELLDKLRNACADAEARLAAADAAAVEQVRIDYLGRNGLFPELSKQMGSAAPEERRELGRAFNESRKRIEEAIAQAKNASASAKNAVSALDVTLPGRKPGSGHRHPISIVTDECVAIFRRMGFVCADGPEIEDIYHNFDALNTPDDHPSRSNSDTFYFADGRILRTQTSPVQIRVMEKGKLPIRIIAPGRVFRPDTPDATHGMNFHQIEGLSIDRGVSMADLKSVLRTMATELFGEKARIRMRPHFFPFTEPSVEYDFSCIMCGGKGCPVCKNSGWIEIAGAGMVDPNVLRNVGINPEIYSGYAFGFGVERLAMLRYHIGDLRCLYENDVRFLAQFQ